jgi:hypothetical protein
MSGRRIVGDSRDCAEKIGLAIIADYLLRNARGDLSLEMELGTLGKG